MPRASYPHPLTLIERYGAHSARAREFCRPVTVRLTPEDYALLEAEAEAYEATIDQQ